MAPSGFIAACLLLSIGAHALSSGSSSSHNHHIIEEPQLYPRSQGPGRLELETKNARESETTRDSETETNDQQRPMDPETRKQVEDLDQAYDEALVSNHFARAAEIKDIEEETRFDAMTTEEKLVHIEQLKKQREKAKKDGDLERAQEINMEIRHYEPEGTSYDRAWQTVEYHEKKVFYWIATAFFEWTPTHKLVLGALMILPALQPMALWLMRGNPPHPFLLARDAVHDPRMWIKIHKWQADILGIVTLVGMDIFLFGYLQQVGWEAGLAAIRAFVILWFGAVGIAIGMYTINWNVHETVTRSISLSGDGLDLLDDHDFVENQIDVKTVYQDPRIGLFMLFITFFVQCCLLAFYWRYISIGSGDLTVTECKFWALAIPLQVIARDMLGRDWHYEIPVWRKLMRSNYVLRKQTDTGKMKKMEVSRTHTNVRAAFSYMANNVIVGSIILTLPLFLMRAGSGIDFVKDCFAVVFISTLDDLSTDVTLEFQSLDDETPA